MSYQKVSHAHMFTKEICLGKLFPENLLKYSPSQKQALNTQHNGHIVQKLSEFVADIYSKSLARAIGKVLLMIFS